MIRLSLHICVKPFSPEPASVAMATNGLKGYFPLKDKPQWGSSGGSGEKGLQLPVSPQVKPGSMHRLFTYECVCVCVCVWQGGTVLKERVCVYDC